MTAAAPVMAAAAAAPDDEEDDPLEVQYIEEFFGLSLKDVDEIYK